MRKLNFREKCAPLKFTHTNALNLQTSTVLIFILKSITSNYTKRVTYWSVEFSQEHSGSQHRHAAAKMSSLR